MVLSPVLLMDLRQVRFLQRASVARVNFSVHHKLHVIAIAIDRRRTEMLAAHQLIAVLKLRLLTYSDRRCNQNYRHACIASNRRSVHHLVHAIVILIAVDQSGARKRRAYQ